MIKQDNNAFRTDHLCHFGDSSNSASEGEGVPEMLQRMSKERDLDMINRMESDTKEQIVCAIGIPVIPVSQKEFDKHIARKLLEGGL